MVGDISVVWVFIAAFFYTVLELIWLNSIKLREARKQKARNMPTRHNIKSFVKECGVSYVPALVLAYVLAWFVSLLRIATIEEGLALGLMMGAMLIAARLPEYYRQQKKFTHWLTKDAYQVLGMVGVTLILAVLS